MHGQFQILYQLFSACRTATCKSLHLEGLGREGGLAAAAAAPRAARHAGTRGRGAEKAPGRHLLE
eukprot:358554-Chlamydomonas_euryale.AAC.1